MNDSALQALLDLLKRADGLFFLPADAGDLAGLLRRSRDSLGIVPPDAYMSLLRRTDGVVADGLMLYGSRSHSFENASMSELVEANLDRRDYREDAAGLLLLGERDDDFIAFRPKDGLYWRVDRLSGELDASAPDLASMISALLRSSVA